MFVHACVLAMYDNTVPIQCMADLIISGSASLIIDCVKIIILGTYTLARNIILYIYYYFKNITK